MALWLLLGEVCALAAIVAGVALFSPPVALIVAGVLGVLICERAAVGRAER